jgi:hypothetical protein
MLTLRKFAPTRWRMNEPERRQTVYAMRNAFAHDYALVNVPPDHRPEGPTTFFVYDRGDGDLITPPKREWSRVWTGSDLEGCETVVSLQMVGDLVEDVVAEVKRRHLLGKVEIALDGGAAEMDIRYFLGHHAPEDEEWAIAALERTLAG